MSNISPLAVVSPKAQIGDNVTIGPFTVIHDDVVIGDGTVIENSVSVFDGARIGKNCHIFPYASISAVPQDLKFKGEYTTAEIGDNNVLRECVTVHRATASKLKTVIGNNNLIMAYCHVAHDCRLGNNIIMSNATQLAGEVVVDDCAVIGGGSLVHQFVHFGAYSMLQGGSRLVKDLPPYCMAGREPVSYAGINLVGLRRRGFNADQIHNIQDIYRVIFQGEKNTTQALEDITANFEDTPEREEIIRFIKGASRGIIKGYN